MLVYVYDIKINNKKILNNIKRRFYYRLRKNNEIFKRRTKSVLLVDENFEEDAEEFFKEWKIILQFTK